jgi:hypothetical protein
MIRKTKDPAAGKVLRASLRERIEMLDRNPDRTRADTREANRLARKHNRSLFRE